MVFADQKSKLLYDYYDPERMKDIDLIISCGDLPQEYLSFFVTLCNVPLLYVRGNHDKSYDANPPEGCTCIEDDIYVYKGIRILGLGGSMQYLPASTRNGRCGIGSGNWASNYGGTKDLIFLSPMPPPIRSMICRISRTEVLPLFSLSWTSIGPSSFSMAMSTPTMPEGLSGRTPMGKLRWSMPTSFMWWSIR